MALILVADDQEQIRLMLKSLFEQFGYEVLLAINEPEALARYHSQPADLVITDIMMPDMEGIETIRELRKINPGVRIIAMSGGGTIRANEYLRMASMFGARRVIEKPFDLRDMLIAVRACLAD
ncbi:MAG: response regulator [candidate division Zixibacteria bacterium]|nr:response regulator [candidate division Zixibacteria bacterium]